MLGFNWVDILILLILAYAIYSGIKIGFIALLFGFGSFFLAVFIAGWVFPRILGVDHRSILLVVNINLVLLAGVLLGIRGYEYGKKLHLSLKNKGRLSLVESIAGLTLSLSSALIIVWLLAAGIGALPFAGLSNSASDSFIIRKMDSILPAAPNVFNDLTHPVNPNSPIILYAKQSPNSSIGVAVKPHGLPSAILKATGAVVRITSFGCGGIVDGSGFVVAKDIVATNAHVIAGVSRPIIKTGNRSIAAVPVMFDPNQDLALLKVNSLNIRPLILSSSVPKPGSDVYVESYPSSIFTITPGTIGNELNTIGPNIYGLGNITRSSYTVYPEINNGSSGGPLLSPDGSVIGIIFAKSNSHLFSYAMTTQILIKDVRNINTSLIAGTGSCAD